MSPFVAEIRIFGFNFAPKGWAFCDGQLLPLSQNTALFSLLGTTYGGDGKSNFALPNLQGSAPMQQGQGPGLSLRDLGESGKAVEEYYYRDGKLIFVYRKESTYDQPLSGKLVSTKENRFYFTNDKLIRWIDENGKQVATDSSEYQEKQKERGEKK